MAVIGAGKFTYPWIYLVIREALTSYPTGPGGLSILKNLREEGFDVTVYEKRDEVGGVWAYSDDVNTTSTLPCKSIRITISSLLLIS